MVVAKLRQGWHLQQLGGLFQGVGHLRQLPTLWVWIGWGGRGLLPRLLALARVLLLAGGRSFQPVLLLRPLLGILHTMMGLGDCRVACSSGPGHRFALLLVA